jgi:hypothetical protein
MTAKIGETYANVEEQIFAAYEVSIYGFYLYRLWLIGCNRMLIKLSQLLVFRRLQGNFGNVFTT